MSKVKTTPRSFDLARRLQSHHRALSKRKLAFSGDYDVEPRLTFEQTRANFDAE